MASVTSGTGVPACVVLLRNLGTGMLREIVAAAIGRQPDVVVHEDRLPAGVDADLVIERDVVDHDTAPGSSATPTLLVSGDGRALLSLPIEQVSESSLGVAVSSVVALKQVARS